MPGGNDTAGVVRIGDTVRRPRRPNSTFVVALLGRLTDAGFSAAPKHLGTDEQGREVFDHLPGRTTDHPSQRSPDAYATVGSMLAELHWVTAGTTLAVDQPCVIHGDPGPYNVIIRDGRPVAFIDWDSAQPGDPLDDLGHLAWTWCLQSVGNVPIADQAEHLAHLAAGYGRIDGSELLAAMESAQNRVIDAETSRLDNPATGAQRRAHAGRAIAWATADRELLLAHRELLLAAIEDR